MIQQQIRKLATVLTTACMVMGPFADAFAAKQPNPADSYTTTTPIKHIVVVFNATNASVIFTNSRLQGVALHLHPVQRNSSDPATKQSTFDPKEGTAKVPALTTAIFVTETE